MSRRKIFNQRQEIIPSTGKVSSGALKAASGLVLQKKPKTAFLCKVLILLHLIIGVYVIVSYESSLNSSDNENMKDLILPTHIEGKGSIGETDISPSITRNGNTEGNQVKRRSNADESTTSAREEDSGDMKSRIVQNMKNTLSTKILPSPPSWPQLDHRIAEAIASGVVLGLDKSTEFNFNHTIVTAYYAFKSKHSVKEYTKWMIGLFQTSDPIIIFVEPNSEWFTVVQKLRQHAPTIIATMKFDDLVMSSTFTKEFWDYEHSIDLEAKVHKGSNVYKIWNEKLIFLYNAIQLNPFQTKGFAWMDTGYFRQIRDAPEVDTPLIKIDYTSAGVPHEKVLVMHVRNDDLNAPGRVNVAGNCFFGSAEAFLTFYHNYYTTFWDWIRVKNKFIGSDQFVMTETCRRYAKGCYPHFAGRFKSWFALSAVVMGKKPLEMSKKYLFLDNPPNDLHELPQGKRITFCNGQVLPVEDALEC